MNSSYTAPFVAIEGIDGAGKTTLQRLLAREWRARGLRVLELREPSRGPTGRRARRLASRDPWTAAMAFTDDRKRQRERIRRALQRGTVVLLDRSFFSTLAYQGSALPPSRRSELERLQHAATLVPHRVILLDLPVDLSEARLSHRGTARDPTERRAVLRRAARTYRVLARRPGWILLNARLSPARLVSQLHRRLTPWVLHRNAQRRAGA
jgi:dTMP kinase